MDDQYLKESTKSYQKCQVANSARRNSLMKKTIGIENQRKLASNHLNREEKLLREQLKSMKVEMAKNSLTSGVKALKTGSLNAKRRPASASKSLAYVEPYPVTFAEYHPQVTRQRSMTSFDSSGMRYAARKGRRQSKEFEDLAMNTSTGQLAIPSHIIHTFRSKSPHSSGGSSPSISPRRKLHGSVSSFDSSENVQWPGDPEAIQSVRRSRKSVGQQGKERVSKIKEDILYRKNSRGKE